MDLRQMWARVPPSVKRRGVVSVIGAGLLVVSYLGVSTLEPRDRRNTADKVIKSVLTENSTRDIGLDAMAAQIAMQNKLIEEQNKKFASLGRDLESAKKAAPPSDESVRHLQGLVTNLQSRLDEAERKLQSGKGPGGRPPGAQGKEDSAGEPTAVPGAIPVEAAEDTPPRPEPNKPPTVDEIFRAAGRRGGGVNSAPSAAPLPAQGSSSQGAAGPTPGAAAGGTALAGPAQVGPVKIVHLRQKAPTGQTAALDEDTNVLHVGDSVQLPAGSILSGTLLTGMDAPTGQSARKDPFPALMRVKKEAILPNRFLLDVRECFILLGGYGDLSSERAYLRAETVSCVRNDGRVVETRLEAFATGEDGKTGIRGRLVSKQGQMIANALLAGFMEGVSKAFDVKPVPVIQTGGAGTIGRQQQYQQNFSTDSFQSAAVSGASSALDRIAQFYIAMAEQTTPVVEVDAGRTVDLIIQRGAKLDFKGKGNSSLPLDSNRASSNGAGLGQIPQQLPGPLPGVGRAGAR